MASLGEFSVRIARRGKQIEDGSNRIIKRLALGIDQAVVIATPVDTGRARSNWITSIGSARQSAISPYTPLPQGKDPAKFGERGNAQGAINQAKIVIASRQPEQTIYISNNVDYIGVLNYDTNPRHGGGWSVQAPQFFVQGAIQAVLDEFRRSKVLE